MSSANTIDRSHCGARRSPCSRWRTRIALALVVVAHVLPGIGTAFAQSYRVFAWPVESPSHGVRTLVTAPHDPVASPFGWHDSNGAPGPESGFLRGNNAHVYLDVNNDNVADGPGPDGGPALAFDYAVDFTAPPSTYYAALATNAFYWTNRLHDIFLRHGFTPGRGNMQANTYGQGGIGNDEVRVEVAKGGQFNNVSYTNAPDGTRPSIRHFVWTSTAPNRESSFDAGTTAWAYSILMFNRLTVNCTSASETPYMGYGDFLGILVTTDFRTATPTTPRGLGTYVLGQPPTGAGIRGIAYSTDLTAFPRTYANMSSLVSPHGTGSIWAVTMWDLTWALIGRYGASHDLLNGNGGENRVLRLAIEGMDQMQCPGGFVSARDSLFVADQLLYGGQNRCLMWQVFARRGLGALAVEGSPFNQSDQTTSFVIPADCDRLFANGFD